MLPHHKSWQSSTFSRKYQLDKPYSHISLIICIVYWTSFQRIKNCPNHAKQLTVFLNMSAFFGPYKRSIHVSSFFFLLESKVPFMQILLNLSPLTIFMQNYTFVRAWKYNCENVAISLMALRKANWKRFMSGLWNEGLLKKNQAAAENVDNNPAILNLSSSPHPCRRN